MSAGLPPPVLVEYASDYQELSGPVQVFAENCGQVLHSFGVDDDRISSTTILVVDRPRTDEREHPTMPVRLRNEVYASSGHIAEDGSGEVTLYMGSVRLNPPQDVPESALLIAGLSQRADLATLGPEGLLAEEEAAWRAIRRQMLTRQGIKGVTIGLAAGFFTKINADRRYRVQAQINEAEQSWPAQLRAAERERNYLNDPDALPLLGRPASGKS